MEILLIIADINVAVLLVRLVHTAVLGLYSYHMMVKYMQQRREQ